MKRKPFAYTGSYDDNDDHMYALNCKDKAQALEEMEKEFDTGNEELTYIRPDFSTVAIRNYNNYFCRICNEFTPDNVCYSCDRTLQGRLHTIYEIDLTLK